jgi:hypothetical protein
MIETTVDWYKANDCTHAHCPEGCDHPQPFVQGDELWCGSCWFMHKVKTFMEPCRPAICVDRHVH